mgnify:CR=1 FL=1
MKKLSIAIIMVLFAASAFAQQRYSGYYKDIFMDGGMYLTSRKDLPAARALGLTYEKVLSAKRGEMTEADSLIQGRLIAGSEIDENGILLYPDGQPRFRMVYMNGGRAANHGRSLGEKGRANYRAFVAAGGSYLGSCAGAFIATDRYESVKGVQKERPTFLHLWGGAGCSTGMLKTYTGMNIPEDSPLLRYGDFGKEHYVDSVRHNGGCFAGDIPEGTEILATYDTEGMQTKREVNGKPSIWAWKTSEKTGRVIMCGSHPEGKTKGGNLTLMNAMVLYALDGVAGPVLKAEIPVGGSRRMTARSWDGRPDFACIGDKQFHHFLVKVPAGKDELTIELVPIKGYGNFDMYLFAAPGQFAFNDNARWADVTPEKVAKKLVIKAPAEGDLYFSVYCGTTVIPYNTKFGVSYSGRIDVLNGVPYEIKVY